MTLKEGFDYINYMIVKENSGGELTPQQLNTVLNAVNIEMFNKKVQDAQLYALQSKIPFDEAIQAFKILREFRTFAGITFIAGSYNLNSLPLYSHWIKLLANFNGFYREVEILTDRDLVNRRTNLLAKRLGEYPACELLGNTIMIYPSNIVSGEFTYLKRPTTPVFDYYLDQYQNLVYFPAGTTHVLVSGETGSQGQTAGILTSLTVELTWNQDYHMDFFNAVLMKVSTKMADEQMKQAVREIEGKQS